MPGLIGGRWRSGRHGEPEGCTRRETGGIEPGRLPLADQPAAYLTGVVAEAHDATQRVGDGREPAGAVIAVALVVLLSGSVFWAGSRTHVMPGLPTSAPRDPLPGIGHRLWSERTHSPTPSRVRWHEIMRTGRKRQIGKARAPWQSSSDAATSSRPQSPR